MPGAAPAAVGNGWVLLGGYKKAALWAGASFQDLMVKGFGEYIPFRQALFLNSKLEDWQEIRHLLPGSHDLWRPRELDNRFGRNFLECPHGPDGGRKLSLDKIRAANDAGVALQFVSINFFCEDYRTDSHATLLDMAIWYGQPDCAKACVGEGIGLKGNDMTLVWHKDVLRGKSLRLNTRVTPVLDLVPSEAQAAAAAAGRAFLKRSWKRESSQKGIVLYQMILKIFKGKSFPMVLVQEILTFSMPSPPDHWSIRSLGTRRWLDGSHLWQTSSVRGPSHNAADATMIGLGKVGLPLKNGNFGYLSVRFLGWTCFVEFFFWEKIRFAIQLVLCSTWGSWLRYLFLLLRDAKIQVRFGRCYFLCRCFWNFNPPKKNRHEIWGGRLQFFSPSLKKDVFLRRITRWRLWHSRKLTAGGPQNDGPWKRYEKVDSL